MGKGEIARHEQFLLFPQCFQKTCTGDTLKPGLVLERVNPLPNDKILDLPKVKVFADHKSNAAQMIAFIFDRLEDIVGKGEK